MSNRVKLVPVILISCLFFGCSHIVPPQARKMPMIKVRHKNKIEQVALEKYVASVLAGEVHASWPIEALKAQAIAARTFALLRMKERKNKDYHVQNSILDQVFKAKPQEIFIEAARQSAGLVLTLDGHLAEASFHSTCGGHTASAKNVWGRSYLHLHGQSCGFCQGSPTYTWRSELNLTDVENKFGQKISSLRIVSRSQDGRVDWIELIGNIKQKIKGHDFRMAMGDMKVKSTMIKNLKVDGSKINISGNGFGHGVGMCQFGAYGMAKKGKTFKTILTHYYPGTEIKRIY
jgi:stage II sporulation protein D